MVSITGISKDYGWSAQKMNEYLHTKGVEMYTWLALQLSLHLVTMFKC